MRPPGSRTDATMDPLPHFSADYAEARAKFIAAARAAGHAVETHLMQDRKGVDGEPLAIDVALAGSQTAENVLVVTSATHGIEGYCGSGVQIALMHDAEVARAAVESRRDRRARACGQSAWLLVRATGQRRQRRSQSQFPRFQRSGAGQRRLRRSPRLAAAATVAAVARERREERGLHRNRTACVRSRPR